jgi:PAS domain S-box-containing protein
MLDVLEGILDSVLVIDKDWNVLYANHKQAHIFGYAPSEMLGRNLWRLLPNIIGTDVERCFLDVMASQKRRTYELDGIYKTGFFEMQIFPITGGIAVCTRDITERKKAEIALHQSEERFAKMFHSSPAALFISRRKDGYLLDVNDNFLKILDYTYDDIAGHTALDLNIYPDPSKRDELARCLEQHHTVRNFEITVQTKTGKQVTVMASIDIIGFDGQDFVLGTFIDITERIKAEEALKQSENRLKMAQRIAHLGSWEFYVKENKALWSEELFHIFNLTPQTYGPTIEEYSQFIHPDDLERTAKIIQPFTCDFHHVGDLISFDYRVVLGDGSVRVLHTERMIEEVDELGKPTKLVGIEQDITERKRIELQLEQYSKHLENLVEERTKQLKDAERLAAIGATAGMVGHDIRNPLQAITNELYLTREAIANAPDVPSKPDALDSVAFIQDQVNYINKIVSDLQDYARPIKPVLVEVDVDTLITNSLSTLPIPDNVKARAYFEKALPKIKTDPMLLKRVLVNLATNALQAMPNGGKLTVKAVQDPKTTKCFLTVQDTGVGIPKEVQAKLFTPLFTTKSKGQGFGLAVVKRLTEALGGSINFESQEGKGTKFVIELPMAPAE